MDNVAIDTPNGSLVVNDNDNIIKEPIAIGNNNWQYEDGEKCLLILASTISER